MKFPKSEQLLERASNVIPGGVNSPVRAFKQVRGVPLFIREGRGAHIIDVDGNKFIDYVGSWGPLILGHGPRLVVDAVAQAAERGTSYGAPTELEIELAELVREIVPSMELMRMVSSGTEATMSAIRLARGFTGRDVIIKFNGCYHGHADSLLVSAGSGVATFGIPGSKGVPDGAAVSTVSIEFNDLELVEKTVSALGPTKVAAIIVEPVPGNMGLVLPQDGYLRGLRELCDKDGIVLIFDEVMTGFRVALGGAQARYAVRPCLTTLGKVVGGGLPVGVFGGRREIMNHLAPLGPVYQAGTLSGNPLAMVAGLATLRYLKQENPYPVLEERGARWARGMSEEAKSFGIPLTAAHCGSMVGLFFSETPVRNFAEAKRSDTERFIHFFHGMLAEGIYLAPSPFEAGFISTEHSDNLIGETLSAARRVFASMR